MSESNQTKWVGVRRTYPSDPIPVTLTEGASGIEKGRSFNQAVLATTNFFAADLAPSHPPTRFRIYITISAAGVLSVIRTSAGAHVTENLNAGVGLNANAAYMFDILVTSADTINLQYSVGATILSCIVVEVGA
jgi:hypothetical protein